MFSRIGNLFRGFFSMFLSGIEKNNPEALLEAASEDLRKQISEYNKGLAAHAGMCERLMTQVKRESQEMREFTAKATAHLKAGNRKLAGEYALRLQKLKVDHEENVKELEAAEKTYEQLKRSRDVAVTAAKEKIDALKKDINETKIAKATAELSEMAAGMINDVGGAGDTLNRLEEMVREERDLAKGRARVAKDSIDSTELNEMEAERSALEEMALADFAADAGIVIDGGDSTDTAAEDALAELENDSKSM